MQRSREMAVLHESSAYDEPPPQDKLPPHEESPFQGKYAVQVIHPALPAMIEVSTPGTPRMHLFFVLGAVQTLQMWILADSGSVRNFIDKAVDNRLPYKPPICDLGNVRVIGGKAEPSNSRALQYCSSPST